MADKENPIDHALKLTFDPKDVARIKIEILYQKIIAKMNQIVDLELLFDTLEKQQLAEGHSADIKQYFTKKAEVKKAIAIQESDLRTAINLFNSYKRELKGEKKEEK